MSASTKAPKVAPAIEAAYRRWLNGTPRSALLPKLQASMPKLTRRALTGFFTALGGGAERKLSPEARAWRKAGAA